MAESLLQFLDAARPETAQHHFAAAMAAAEEHGAVAAGLGLSLSQTVEVSSDSVHRSTRSSPDGTTAGFR